jgi:hypothetical protein
MPDKKTLLKDTINAYFDKFVMENSTGTDFYEAFPNTLLHPRDYLDYAEKELKKLDDGEDHLINCVGHLKRAIDSQIDTFFHIIGVHNIFKKRNLKFDKKLEFLKQMDVISPRTLSRFNRIRNEIEHEHNLPSDLDLEVFFDLTEAFISSIELTIVLLTTSETVYEVRRYGDKLIQVGDVFVNESEGKDEFEMVEGDSFIMRHSFPTPEIEFSWKLDNQEQTLNSRLSNASNENDVMDFAYFLRVLILLLKFEGFGTSNLYIYEHI